MPVHRRAFALILVLVAVAGVFALAVHSAVVTRTNTIEERVLRERLVGEREARAAAAIALQGLMIMTDQQRAIAEGVATGEDAEALSGSGGKPQSRIEFPEFLQGFFEDAGVDLSGGAQEVLDDVSEEEAAQAEAATRGKGSGDVARITGVRFLSVVGIPGTPIDVPIGTRNYRVRFTDALGLLNVNQAPEEQLYAYFRAKNIDAGTANRLVDQIIDWRDADDQQRPLGAERERYLRLGITPRNAEIVTLDELRYLPAMTLELFERIRADLCMSGSGVHAGSAPAAVLQSVPDLSADRVQRILDLRAQGALTMKAFDEIVPKSEAELRDRIRFAPSNIVAISVEDTDRPGATFEGIATITDQGVTHIALMPR